MAKNKFSRGHRSIKTRPIQRRYLGFFKAKYIKLELVPYLILAGLKHEPKTAITNLCSMQDLALVIKKESADVSSAREELLAYIHHELPFIKEYNFDAICNLLRIGATLLQNKKTNSGLPWQKAHIFKNAQHKVKHGKLMRYLLNGVDDMLWYENTKAAFETLLVGMDSELSVKLFALTSPRTQYDANVSLAIRAYKMFVGITEFRTDGYLGSVASLLTQFHGNTFDFTPGVRGSKRKVINFGSSINGEDNVTVDMWIGRAFAVISYYDFEGKRYPYTIRDSEYDVVEAYIKGVAEVTGFKAKHMNAMLWLGIRQEEYKRHITSNPVTLLMKALRKHGDEKLLKYAENKIIFRTPVQYLDKRVQCLDYSKPERERVYQVLNSKPGSAHYRTFDGKPRRYCNDCPFPEGCITCTLP